MSGFSHPKCCYYGVVIVILALAFRLSKCKAAENREICPIPDIPVVRNVSDLLQDSYGRLGLSHITIAGAHHHGMKEVEVWLQTFAPGSGTPIHRHECEEVFLILKGGGTLFLALASHTSFPGEPLEFEISANTTFTIPVDSVHQLRNTKQNEDLQVLAIISRPPIKVFVYQDWFTSHDAAALQFPYPWDKQWVHAAATDQCDV